MVLQNNEERKSSQVNDVGPIGCPNGININLDPLSQNICKYQL